jgi:hypothetical protein
VGKHHGMCLCQLFCALWSFWRLFIPLFSLYGSCLGVGGALCGSSGPTSGSLAGIIAICVLLKAGCASLVPPFRISHFAPSSVPIFAFRISYFGLACLPSLSSSFTHSFGRSVPRYLFPLISRIADLPRVDIRRYSWHCRTVAPS